jgi:hypothetical protein
MTWICGKGLFAIIQFNITLQLRVDPLGHSNLAGFPESLVLVHQLI